MKLEQLETERRNQNTMDIDHCTPLEIVTKINQEDHKVADAVETQLDVIAQIVEEASKRLLKGGRIIYMGAGTSGRLGVLDASECPPTYGVSSDLVIGLIAGGQSAMFKAKEGAEDSEELGVQDLKQINLNENDTVVGLAASGRTPYVIGGLKYANEIGALTASVSCVSNAPMSSYATYPVEAVTGAECVTGSTRMKAGTAEKMICNMISTGCMIRYGKVYENLMIDVQPTNEKLVNRAKRIIEEAVHCDYQTAEQLYEQSNHDVKIAVIMGKAHAQLDQAQQLLQQTNGNVFEAITLIGK